MVGLARSPGLAPCRYLRLVTASWHPPASIVVRAGAAIGGPWAASVADADDHRYKHDPRARWAPPAPRPCRRAPAGTPQCTRRREKVRATVDDGAGASTGAGPDAPLLTRAVVLHQASPVDRRRQLVRLLLAAGRLL